MKNGYFRYPNEAKKLIPMWKCVFREAIVYLLLHYVIVVYLRHVERDA